MLKALLQRKVTVMMLFASFVLFGLLSLNRMPINLLPEIEFPGLTVLTRYVGAPANEIDNLITKNIESVVSSVTGIKSYESWSDEGLSIISLKFEWGTDMSLAMLNLRQKIDSIRNLLPQDAERPIIIDFSPAEAPLLNVAVSSKSVPFNKLRDIVQQSLKSELEVIEGVSNVTILGGYQKEIKVLLDPLKVAAYKLSIRDIQEAIQASNVSIPAGNLIESTREYTVRLASRYKTLKEIRNTVITVTKQGVPIYLKDVARIQNGEKKRTGALLSNGKEIILLQFRKSPGANGIQTSSNIRSKLAELSSSRPWFRYRIISDASEYIRRAIGNVNTSLILGGIIAFLILFAFLNSSKYAIAVMITIPVSVIFTFMLMYMSGISINIVSLSGLALGIGMLVDNSIVVTDSIEAQCGQRNSWDLSSLTKAVQTVTSSCISSTFTSIIVFLPIIFIEGIAAAVFKDLAWTVTYSLLTSLFSALVLTPVILAALQNMKIRELPLANIAKTFMEHIRTLLRNLVSFLESIYSSSLVVVFSYPKIAVLGGLLLIGFGAYLTTFLRTSIFPTPKTTLMKATLELAPGTPLKDSILFTKRFHRFLRENANVSEVTSKIGYDEESIQDLVSGKKNSNYISMFLTVTKQEAVRTTITAFRAFLAKRTDLRYTIALEGDSLQNFLNRQSGSFQIRFLQNKDIAISKTVQRTESVLRKMAPQADIRTSIERNGREISFAPDKLKTASFGLQPADAGFMLRALVHGEKVTNIQEGDIEYPIRVQLSRKYRKSRKKISNLIVPIANGKSVLISQFLENKLSDSSGKIYRLNGEKNQFVQVSSGNIEEIIPLIQAWLSQNKIDAEIIRGNQETRKSLSELVSGFLIAMVLIYMLLASQFESYLQPFSVALTIPVILPLIVVTLLLTGNSLSIISGIGIIMLAGMGVNNTIVLFEFIEAHKKEGKYHKLLDLLPAVQQAGKARLRPILLTSLTTIFALVPMAFSRTEGSETQSPLAIVVLVGIFASATIALVYFPLIYSIIEIGKSRIIKNET